ncbi:MAG: hypothetical protein Q4B48_02410, partial [Syntrophomonadaceae bacterium]|nr:hypothetical protein [Syntrophomonadaceae bacterium]
RVWKRLILYLSFGQDNGTANIDFFLAALNGNNPWRHPCLPHPVHGLIIACIKPETDMALMAACSQRFFDFSIHLAFPRHNHFFSWLIKILSPFRKLIRLPNTTGIKRADLPLHQA